MPETTPQGTSHSPHRADIPEAPPETATDRLIVHIEPIDGAAVTRALLTEIAASPQTPNGKPAIDQTASLQPPAWLLEPVAAGPTAEEITALRRDAIARALAGLLTTEPAPARLSTAQRMAVANAYAERNHAPLWVSETGITRQGQRLLETLADAPSHGLAASAYQVTIGANAPGFTDRMAPESLAALDLRLSLAAVLYARDARGGRINPRSLSPLLTPNIVLPDAGDVLTTLAAADHAGEALAGYNPPHERYRALRQQLAMARQSTAATAPRPIIPAGKLLRPGQPDPRVAALRERLGMPASDDLRLTGDVLDALRAFQAAHRLPATGTLSRATLAALNHRPQATLESDIIANMERWRWLPADLGAEHIIVNVPEFVMRKIENGRVVHKARVVVGKTERPTPIFSDVMDHLVLNPSWTVPPTILKEDYLPKLALDPTYAARKGLDVIQHGNQITLRQPPGPTNALGNIKFMFPNRHAVYLHDTPARSLFSHARRAYSSGCVRVEQPLKLAELVLGGATAGWSEERLRRMIGSGERTIRLSKRLPIHLVYETLVVRPDGGLDRFDDLYGFNRLVRAALAGRA